MSIVKNACRIAGVAAMALTVAILGPTSGSFAATKKVPEYSKQAFLDAAFDNCAAGGSSPRSCKCEQMLIDSDRLTKDDKEIAYYFWTDKKEYHKQSAAKRTADPEWQAAFSQRFTNLQALIMSACGK